MNPAATAQPAPAVRGGQPAATGATDKRFWLAALTRNERTTWAACFGGRVLDAMDAQVYALTLPTLITVFALTRSQAGLLGSLTTFIAALSTIAAGAAADRFGRLRVLQVAIAISAVSTALAAFAHSFGYLAAIRAVQGIGYAAELTASSTLVTEAIRTQYRGRAVSAVQSGYAIGYLLALGGMLATYALVPETIAWRVLFALGLIPALYVVVLQQFVSESPLFLAERERVHETGSPATVLDVLRGRNGRNTLITAMISVGVYGAAQIIIFWLPTYLRTAFHLNVTKTAGYLVLNIIGSFIGPLLYGPISDRLGRRPVFLIFLAAQAITVACYLHFTSVLVVTLGLGLLVGLMQGGLATGVQPIIAELFGTRIRGRAIGVNACVIRGVAATTPALVGVMASHMAFGRAMGTVAISLYGVAAIGVLLVRETSGVDLTTEIVPPPVDVTALPSLQRTGSER